MEKLFFTDKEITLKKEISEFLVKELAPIQDEINKKDIRIGDTVIVQRAGDVIPEVVKVVTSKRTGKERHFVIPATCPVCGSDVLKAEDEVVSRCLGISCKSTAWGPAASGGIGP